MPLRSDPWCDGDEPAVVGAVEQLRGPPDREIRNEGEDPDECCKTFDPGAGSVDRELQLGEDSLHVVEYMFSLICQRSGHDSIVPSMPKGGVGRRVDEEIPALAVESSRVAEIVIAAASSADFAAAAMGPTQYQLSRSYRPGWVVPTAIVGTLFFGLGLLLLFLVPKRTERCLASISEGRRGVSVRLSGSLPSTVVEQIRSDLGGHAPQPPRAAAPSPVAWSPTLTVSDPPPPVPVASPSPPGPSQLRPSVPPTVYSWSPSANPVPIPPLPVEATVARSSILGDGLRRGPTIVLGGQTVPIDEGVVVGRNPAALDALPGARLVPIGDSGLSKTHFAVRLAAAMIEVCDLSSTNGTAIDGGAARRQCVAGVWLAVYPGECIVAGDHRITINA